MNNTIKNNVEKRAEGETFSRSCANNALRSSSSANCTGHVFSRSLAESLRKRHSSGLACESGG